MKFGVEIECLVPIDNNQNNQIRFREWVEVQREICDALNDLGIYTSASETYTHRRTSYWKIVYDRSVNCSGKYGMEFVSPPMRYNDESKEEIRKVVKYLSSIGAIVNKTCGLHVHVDASDISLDSAKMLLRRYNKYEELIDSFFPLSRRGNTNSFCQSTNNMMAYVDDASSIGGIYHDRYRKLNFRSYEQHGTIEFRQHQGTLHPEKIWNWITFIRDFVAQTKKFATSYEYVKSQPEIFTILGIRNKRFLNRCLDIIRLSLSTSETLDVVLDNMKWSLSDVQKFKAFAVYLGFSRLLNSTSEGYSDENYRENYRSLMLTIEGRVSNFIASLKPMNVRTEIPSQIVDEGLFMGIDEKVVSYYKKRANIEEVRNDDSDEIVPNTEDQSSLQNDNDNLDEILTLSTNNPSILINNETIGSLSPSRMQNLTTRIVAAIDDMLYFRGI